MPTENPIPGVTLSPMHQDLLEKQSGINPEVIAERGYRTATDPAELRELGFQPDQCRTPALAIPFRGLDGEIILCQIRPDEPRMGRDGNLNKYEFPTGSHWVIDVPPRVRAGALDPRVPLLVTEGVRKADAAVSRGLCCIALADVWGWKKPADFWDRIPLKSRKVLLAFDSDVTSNPNVQRAAVELKSHLEQHGAIISFICLSPTNNGEKVGLDDFFASGSSVDDLMRLEVDTLPQLNETEDTISPRYVRTDAGICLEMKTRKGEVYYRPLTNFDARIVTEVTLTDGSDNSKEFEIEADIIGEKIRVPVPAERFNNMDWGTECLGARAVIHAAPGTKEHARAAIQLLSIEGLAHRTVYEHIGWVWDHGHLWYLHAGGAIGANPQGTKNLRPEEGPSCNLQLDQGLGQHGPVGTNGPLPQEVRVVPPLTRIEGPLSMYRLPDPPTGNLLVQAIWKSLRLLTLVPDHIGLPLFAATYRAPLGDNCCTLTVEGLTGRGKTTLLALFQQHYGAEMDFEHSPASWRSTSNFLEAMAHRVKDGVLFVDDWLARGSRSDIERANREADNFLRSVANGSGRGRCDRDGRPRTPKPPRCLVLSSQEDSPEGHSLNARMLRIPVKHLDIHSPENSPRLTICQKDAAKGWYAMSMAGYLQWLAGEYKERQLEFQHRTVEFRQTASSSCSHLRTATTISELLAGFEIFLDFAESAGVINEKQYEDYFARMNAALIHLAEEQSIQLASQDPIEHFFELLHAAFISRRCHIEKVDGSAPEAADSWGWRAERYVVKESGELRGGKQESTDNEQGVISVADSEEIEWEEKVRWRPSNRRIGWLDCTHLCLIPAAAVAAAQEQANAMGQHFNLNAKSLGVQLDERGKLAAKDPGKRGKKRKTVRINAADKRHEVLRIEASLVMREEHFGQYWSEPDYDGPPLEDLLDG